VSGGGFNRRLSSSEGGGRGEEKGKERRRGEKGMDKGTATSTRGL